jgi:Mrp family chromosome partitioning ATPase
MSAQTARMFEELRSSFDIIIIDTAPISLVADTSILAEHADTCLQVIRLNYSKRSSLKQLDAFSNNHVKQTQHIVINGEVIPRGKYYSYNYYQESKD